MFNVQLIAPLVDRLVRLYDIYIYLFWNIFKLIFNLFPGIYAIIFEYLYQISFILTPKIVHYASALYSVKFVVIILQVNIFTSCVPS